MDIFISEIIYAKLFKLGRQSSLVETFMWTKFQAKIQNFDGIGKMGSDQGCQPYPILGYNTPFRYFVPQKILYPRGTFFVPHFRFWSLSYDELIF